MVDKKLFLHDLAIVAIMKNEGHYLKEWLDYHLLAGVDHFYIYDNESPDNQAEVAKPYVAAGLVDYFFLPGKAMQYIAYNDAVKRFKFQCRYMAFIDGDEFIYPKRLTGGGITNIVDEILSNNPNAAGLAINWQIFGSNGQEKADYSRGVLERFTRCAVKDFKANAHVKTIANPRKVNFLLNCHYPIYFEDNYSVNEHEGFVHTAFNRPVTDDKIVINHYHCKSLEEYRLKNIRGEADRIQIDKCNDKYSDALFADHDRNEVFDDGILRYRAARADKFSLEDDLQRRNRLTDAVIKILSAYADDKIFDLETALTCRAASNYLREKIYEEASLAAILKSLNGLKFSDTRLLIRELPNLLTLPYPVVNELRNSCLQIIPQMMNVMHLNNMWKDYVELDYLQRFLQTWQPK